MYKILKFLFGYPFVIAIFPQRISYFNKLRPEHKFCLLRRKKEIIKEIYWAWRNGKGIFHYLNPIFLKGTIFNILHYHKGNI